MTEVKKEIVKYTIIAAAITEIISLPLLGLNIMFPYGLAIGVCVAILNLNIISKSIEKAVAQGKRSPVIVGFFIRTALYAGGFYLAVTTSLISGLAAAIGFVLPHIVLYIRKAILPALKRKISKEPAPIYVADTSINLFIKEPEMVLSKNSRTYLTYRHYRKRRIPQESGEANGA
jgi:ATP synthase I chain.